MNITETKKKTQTQLLCILNLFDKILYFLPHQMVIIIFFAGEVNIDFLLIMKKVFLLFIWKEN